MGKEGKPYGGFGRRRLVYPRLIEARNYGSQLTLFINEEITLSLGPADIFPETFLLQYDEGASRVIHNMNGTELNKMVYHDTDQRAAVSVERDKGLRVHGIIRDSLRIRPVIIVERSSAGHIAHEIFSVDEHFSNTRDDYLEVPPLQPAQLIKERSITVPSTVRPEIMMLVDTTRNKNLKRPIKVALYAGVLMASVNIRYSSMTDPKLKTRLCFVKILSKKLTRDLYKYVTYQGTEYLDASATLDSLKQEVRKTSYEKYDAVLLLTKFGVPVPRPHGRSWTSMSSGIAYLAGVCLEGKVALLEDDGLSHSGVYTAAHELGHLLGCPHDGGQAPPSLPNSPGAASCSDSDGFLMTSAITDTSNKNIYQLSSCSKEQIRYVAEHDDYECLRKRTLRSDLSTDRLPGSVTTPNETCEMNLRAFNRSGGYHEDKDGMLERCVLYCTTSPDQDGRFSLLNVTAPDGTRCSDSKPPKLCIAEECVDWI
ncbi:A disintegrin and metalloproteinase with thrombospondin motifs 5-like [Ixodes scapularis]|uniref:A disintegrin and metalloproteinase with thrombospondin motifs 5-like n=1 Tax=Ixodes scapularis TaxID=6945 RepID=UPI001A9D5736|nr:A disintegrin and metalloproteinase with thrombospondin motifs 5-like [Ixodes scapularis]